MCIEIEISCVLAGAQVNLLLNSYYGTKIQKEKSLLNRKPFQLHFLLYHLLSKMSRGLQKCWLKNTFHNIYFLSEIFWKKDIINPIGKGWKNLPIKLRLHNTNTGHKKALVDYIFSKLTVSYIRNLPIWNEMVWWNG